MGILDKFLGKSERSIKKYEELDLTQYEVEVPEEAEKFIKVAEVTSITDAAEIRKQIYDGNIIIADVALLKHDKLMLDRLLKDLKQLADDINGDIVGLGENYIIITPTGIKIDRNKIGGIRK